MRLPLLEITKNNAFLKQLRFEGLNQQSVIDDAELFSGINLNSDHMPKLAPRNPRESLGYTISSPTGFIVASNGKIATISGTNFIYDGATKGTVTAGEKSLVEFNNVLVIFPDKKYYNMGTDTFGTFTSPDIEFAVAFGNRVFACKDSYVYVSKWGTYDDWSTFDGVETDSYETDVYSEGSFIGITKYQNHVVFFKDDFMYETYGYTPSQFTLQEVANVGALSNKSITICNGVLYFVGKNNVYVYSGGVPRAIGDKLNETYVSAVAGSTKEKIYIKVNNGVTNKIYVYDFVKGVWIPEDNLNVVEFCKYDGYLYALSIGGEIYKLNSGTENIEWEAVTKEYNDDTFRKKINTLVKLHLEMSEDSSVDIYTKYNQGAWLLEKTVTKTATDPETRDKRAFIKTKYRTDTFQIKLVCSGDVKIYGEREYIKGSER